MKQVPETKTRSELLEVVFASAAPARTNTLPASRAPVQVSKAPARSALDDMFEARAAYAALEAGIGSPRAVNITEVFARAVSDRTPFARAS